MTSTTTGAPTGVAPGAPTAPATPAAKSRRSGGHLGSYLLIRFLLIFPTIFILVTTVFVLMRSTGDPITASLGGRLTHDQLQERIHAAGYDRPIIVQYLDYLGKLLHGDFGTTISDNRPVTQVVVTYGTATLELAVYALLVALLIGIPLGRIAAARRDRGVDASLRVSGIVAYATPVFFAGILLKLVFSVWLGWLPVAGRASTDAQIEIQRNGAGTGIYLIDAISTGDPAVVWDVIQHAILPAVALGLLTGGIFLRLVRTNVIGTLSTGYVEAARSRGVNERRDDVDDEVGQGHEDGEEDDHALHGHEVTGLHVLDELEAETLPLEGRLGQDGAAQQQRDLQSDDRDDRHEGRTPGMLAQQSPLVDAA